MNATMQARLSQLKGEYQQGEAQLRALLQQEATLHETLLRISGAIQVLEELLAHDLANGDSRNSADPGQSDSSPEAEPGTDAKPVIMTVP